MWQRRRVAASRRTTRIWSGGPAPLSRRSRCTRGRGGLSAANRRDIDPDWYSYQRGGGAAPVHIFERLFSRPGRIRNLKQLVALHRLDPCRRRKMMVCVDAELLGSILRLRASGQEVRAAGGRRYSQCSNCAGQETSTVRYAHKSPPRILNRNFGFRPLACASYASPALDTTNLPPERVAKSNSRKQDYRSVAPFRFSTRSYLCYSAGSGLYILSLNADGRSLWQKWSPVA